MRWIEPSGPDGFLMGDEREKQTRTVIERGFWMADTLCTETFFSSFDPCFSNTSKHPKTTVSANDAEKFLARINEYLGEGAELDLPTDAEWEYACRAGTKTAYWWGEEPDHTLANFDWKVGSTSAVKTYPANPWGLFDMHGNVWEWCAATKIQANGKDQETDVRKHTLRGGSWCSPAELVRAASRLVIGPGNRTWSIGFRLVMRPINKPRRWVEGIGSPA